MNVWINLTPARGNQGVSIPQARTDATVCLVGEIMVLIAALILTNVLRGPLTGAHPIHGVLTLKDRTVAFAYLVGGTVVIILVSILTNVRKEDTAVQPTHIASTRKAHTDAIATAVSTDLGTDVMMIAV